MNGSPVDHGVAFFMCGTPSDRRGFEYCSLGPSELPGDPSAYLDRAPQGRREACSEIGRVRIDGSDYVRFARSFGIHPNDARTNRGAYLAAGFIARTRLSTHLASNCIASALCVAAKLEAWLSEGQLPQNFRLRDAAPSLVVEDDAILQRASPLVLTDLLQQAAAGSGEFAKASPNRVYISGASDGSDIEEFLHFAASEANDALRLEREREDLHRFSVAVGTAAARLQSETDALARLSDTLRERGPVLAKLGEEIRALTAKSTAIASASAKTPDSTVRRKHTRAEDSTSKMRPAVRTARPRPTKRGSRARRWPDLAFDSRVRATLGFVLLLVAAGAVAGSTAYFMREPELARPSSPLAVTAPIGHPEHQGSPQTEPQLTTVPGPALPLAAEPTLSVDEKVAPVVQDRHAPPVATGTDDSDILERRREALGQ